METTQLNNSNTISYMKTNMGTILLHIFAYGVLMACALLGSLADTITALFVLIMLIFVELKTRGEQNEHIK